VGNKKNSIRLIFISILLFGCSSSYIIQQNELSNFIPRIESLSDKYITRVTLTNGEEFFTSSVRIKNDTLYIQKYKPEAIPLEQVSTLKLRDQARGFFDGVLMGIPVGIAAILLGPKLFYSDSREFGAYGAMLVGGSAYLLTILANTYYGGNKTFVFKRNEDNTFSRIE
jgi:hypothetical protein